MTSQWEFAIDEVISNWEKGPDLTDPNLLKNCPEFQIGTDKAELKECNSVLFKCFYQNRDAKIKIKNEWYHYNVKIEEMKHQRSSLHLWVNMGNGDKDSSISLRLKNSCHQIELPSGYYQTTFFKKTSNIKEKLWHTSGVEYFVDKFKVRNYEVLEWAKKKNFVKIVNQITGKDPFSAATSLSIEEMNAFCHDHVSIVLTSRIHDALTYHYGRQSRKEMSDIPPSINAAPHPFGPRKDDGPQFKDKFEKEGCSKIYSKDCGENKVKRSFPEGLGWSGVAEILGGEMEYVQNPYLPRRNLVASSSYFEFNSSWHQAGEFAYWDGQGFDIQNFNFFGLAPVIDPGIKNFKFKVGFRCMDKKYGGEK